MLHPPIFLFDRVATVSVGVHDVLLYSWPIYSTYTRSDSGTTFLMNWFVPSQREYHIFSADPQDI